MNAAETQCVAIWGAAATSTFGIVVGVNDAMKARATLYRVRKLLGDVDLQSLQIRVSPDDSEHELWIVRRSEGSAADPVADPATDPIGLLG